MDQDEITTSSPVRSRLSAVIFVLLLAIPAVGTILFGAVNSITWVLLVGLVSVIAAAWLWRSWDTGEFLIDLSPLQVPLAVMIALALIQLLPLGTDLSSAALTIPATHTLTMDPNNTRWFLRALVVLLFFLSACRTFISSEGRIRTATVFTIVFGAIMAFIGILQRIADPESIYGMRVPFQAIPFGPFVNQHHFAGFMEMTGGLTLGLLMGRSVPRERKFLLGLALIVMIAALILTSSRGGMLSFVSAAVLAAVLSFVFHREKGTRQTSYRELIPFVVPAILLIITTVGLVLFLGGDDSLTRGLGLAAGGGGQQDVANGRFHFWSVAMRIFLDHPILGAGFEAFGAAFTQYDTWNGIFRIEQAHNEYVQMLADGGILGFGAVGAFIVLVFKNAISTIKASAAASLRREAAIGALAGCFGIMVHSFFDFPLRTWSNSFFLMVLVTIATVTVATEAGGVPHKVRRRRTSAR